MAVDGSGNILLSDSDLGTVVLSGDGSDWRLGLTDRKNGRLGLSLSLVGSVASTCSSWVP